MNKNTHCPNCGEWIHPSYLPHKCRRKQPSIGKALGTNHDLDAILNTMRDLILEAKPEEIKELVKEAGLDFQELAQAGRRAAEKALNQHASL